MAMRTSVWDSDELLELNRQRLLRNARERMHFFEIRFGLSSSDLEAALDAGKIKETPDIGQWLFALHTYRSLDHA